MLSGQKRSRLNEFLASGIRLMVHPFTGMGGLENQVEGVSWCDLLQKHTPKTGLRANGLFGS